MSKPDPLIGQVVGRRYEVVRLVGKGGMGAVYEVRHLRVQRSFALKKLSAALAEEPEALARFQREADVVASLRHPHVVEIIDRETLDDGSPCMIMELLKGEDLSTRLARGGPLPWSLLGRIADQVLSALSVAHRAGIVHRDLKPQNIFLVRDDAGEQRAKLLDFGVSKIRHSASVTADDRLLGTPAYMSPEQADGQSELIGSATDVWAMGAILFEMATAKQAFKATSIPAVLHRIAFGAPEPLSPHRPDAPPAFVALVGAAMSRDAGQRIVDIGTMRKQLRSALDGVAPGAFPEILEDAVPRIDTGTVPLLDPATLMTPMGDSTTTSTLSHAAGEPSRALVTLRPRRRALWLGSGAAAVAALAVGIWFAARGAGAPSSHPASGPRATDLPAESPAAPPNLPAANPKPLITHPPEPVVVPAPVLAASKPAATKPPTKRVGKRRVEKAKKPIAARPNPAAVPAKPAPPVEAPKPVKPKSDGLITPYKK